MRVGITGHQARDGIDWSWVKQAIRAELVKLSGVEQGISSLAVGSDQVFADTALGLNIPVLAVIPVDDYEKYLKGEGLKNYKRIISQCEVINLSRKGDAERAFLEAGKVVVRKANILIAVWDGKKAEGEGGTADIVHFAQNESKRVIHINPITKYIEELSP